MMAPTVIEWYGPASTVEGARKLASDVRRERSHKGIFLAIGRATAWNVFARRDIRFVGIGTHGDELVKDHPKLSRIPALELWVGWSIPYPTPKEHWPADGLDPQLEDAEWAHARLLRPAMNDRKTKGTPPRPLLVLNRWFEARAPHKPRPSPHKRWPDLFVYPVLHGRLGGPSQQPHLEWAAQCWLWPAKRVEFVRLIRDDNAAEG